MKQIVFITLSIIVTGCVATSPYQLTVDDYMLVAPKISLEMPKAPVIEILQPSPSRVEKYRNQTTKHV